MGGPEGSFSRSTHLPALCRTPPIRLLSVANFAEWRLLSAKPAAVPRSRLRKVHGGSCFFCLHEPSRLSTQVSPAGHPPGSRRPVGVCRQADRKVSQPRPGRPPQGSPLPVDQLGVRPLPVRLKEYQVMREWERRHTSIRPFVRFWDQSRLPDRGDSRCSVASKVECECCRGDGSGAWFRPPFRLPHRRVRTGSWARSQMVACGCFGVR